MTSIYQLCLGDAFAKLHPKMQKRFGFSSEDSIASIGKGVMERVWRGPFYTLPFLYVGTWRNIMFPAKGENIPFTVENYAYQDSYGRETVTWIRTFSFPDRARRFDATMIYSPERGTVVDYLGNHQHLAVDIHLSVMEDVLEGIARADCQRKGGVLLRSGEQRFYEGPIAFRFPLFFSGIANVCEWFDEATGRFQIEVKVSNRVWGPLFGYRGSFDVTYIDARASDIPPHVKPLREESRE